VLLHDIAYDCEGEPIRVTLVRRAGVRQSDAMPAPATETWPEAPEAEPPPAYFEAEGLLAAARAEADQILIRARAEARRLRAASLEGEGGVAVADDVALREDARRYALEVLENLESYTTQMLDSVRKSREWLESQ
jgi:hypothetical protein